MSIFKRLYDNKYVVPVEPDLTFPSQTILVTGANVGLGYETALKFAQHGASRVILAVRNAEKGAAAKSSIETRLSVDSPTDKPACTIDVWQLDMDSYDSIRALAARASSELDRLDVAVLNAGVYMPERCESDYGWEETLQVNTLSTVLLALLLAPCLRRSTKATSNIATLEFVSSGRHYVATLTDVQHAGNVDMLAGCNDGQGAPHAGATQYKLSKLMLMYAYQHIAAKVASPNPESPEFWVQAVCPGWAKSDLARNISSSLVRWIMWALEVLQRETEEGARTLVSGVGLGSKGHGKFWQNDIIRDPAPLLIGEEGAALQEKTWRSIVDALQKDVPDLPDILQEAGV